MSEHIQLGRLLIERGLISAAQLDSALDERLRTSRSLGRALIEMGAVTEADLVATLAQQIGYDYIDLDRTAIAPDVAALVPEAVARRHQVIAVGWEDGCLLVAMADPSNVVAVDDVRAVTGVEVRPVVSTRSAIEAAIDRLSGAARECRAAAPGPSSTPAPMSTTIAAPVPATNALAAAVADLLATAIDAGTSALLFEPGADDALVRGRVDGVLHEHRRWTIGEHQAAAEALLELVGDSGTATVELAGRAVVLRVNVLESVHGPRVVVRPTTGAVLLLGLHELGFQEAALGRYQQVCARASGAIVIAGPAGSGVTTTLRTTVATLTDASRSVVAVEQATEVEGPGVVHVTTGAGGASATEAAVRGALAGDVDVLVVDSPVARDGVEQVLTAAMEGRMVLLAGRAPEAAAVPGQLVAMGISPHVVAGGLVCVVGQRLLRRLCLACARPHLPAQAELAGAGWDGEDDDGAVPAVRRPVGCPACRGTGYHGRAGVHEVLVLSEEMAGLVAQRANTTDVRKLAIAQGMLTLRQAALASAASGVTSLAEVVRVLG